MKIALGLRVLLTLFVTVLMPFEWGHCATIAPAASVVDIDSDHHADGHHNDCDHGDACPQSGVMVTRAEQRPWC